jgi:hypothetical protein
MAPSSFGCWLVSRALPRLKADVSRGGVASVTQTSDPPDGWGSDDLTEFIDQARWNEYCTFDNYRLAYGRIRDADDLYSLLIPVVGNSAHWFSGLFVLSAHATFRAAIRMALSTALPETYPLLRKSLESSLYSLHVARNPELREVWRNRGLDPESRKTCRTRFSQAEVMKTLKAEDQLLANRVANLYEFTIDRGGHPNEQSILTHLKRVRNEQGTAITMDYLAGAVPALDETLRTVSVAMVESLDVFFQVYPEQVVDLGLGARLAALKGTSP